MIRFLFNEHFVLLVSLNEFSQSFKIFTLDIEFEILFLNINTHCVKRAFIHMESERNILILQVQTVQVGRLIMEFKSLKVKFILLS